MSFCLAAASVVALSAGWVGLLAVPIYFNAVWLAIGSGGAFAVLGTKSMMSHRNNSYNWAIGFGLLAVAALGVMGVGIALHTLGL